MNHHGRSGTTAARVELHDVGAEPGRGDDAFQRILACVTGARSMRDDDGHTSRR
jgi:hypothetical protein